MKSKAYRQWYYDGEWHEHPKPKLNEVQYVPMVVSLPAGFTRFDLTEFIPRLHDERALERKPDEP